MRAEEFEVLFETHAQSLFAFVAYRTGDRALAEDVLSDTFERALRSRTRFDPAKGEAKSWLYTIALNRLRDLKRRSAVEARAIEQLGAEAETADLGFEERVLSTGEVQAALGAVSDEEREALALRFGGDLTVPEIAELLNLPLSRAEGRVYRGLRKLRAQLAAPAPGEPDRR